MIDGLLHKMITLLEDQAKMCHTFSAGLCNITNPFQATSLHNECKIYVAQNFGGLLCKNILTEKKLADWLLCTANQLG